MKVTRECPNGLPSDDASPARPGESAELILVTADDDMNDADLALLNDALERSFEALNAGRFRPARDVVAELRHRFR
jgi:hypothetical protein